MSFVGKGAFGKVYTAEVNGHACAVKVEDKSIARPLLEYEAKVLQCLRDCPHVPGFIKYWTNGDRYLAMDLQGENLETALREGRLPLERVSRVVAPQMLQALQTVHAHKFLHRDIKPQNVLFGKHNADTIYLIDFGLAKKYIMQDGTHIPFRANKSVRVGNIRYCGLNMMMGNESSRRDDLESLGYMLIYLANQGTLPWMRIEKDAAASSTTIFEHAKAAKMNLDVAELCKDLPTAYKHYLLHARALKFDQRPDYAFMRSLFATAALSTATKDSSSSLSVVSQKDHNVSSVASSAATKPPLEHQ